MATKKDLRRQRIKYGVRSKISGTSERPRLSVFRSNTSITAQLIDDVKEKESIKIDMAILELINKFLNEHENRWRPLKTSIQAFIKKFQNPKDGTGLIDYSHWIESKI